MIEVYREETEMLGKSLVRIPYTLLSIPPLDIEWPSERIDVDGCRGEEAEILGKYLVYISHALLLLSRMA